MTRTSAEISAAIVGRSLSYATKQQKGEYMEIEFTDRYGGHTPAWIRGCHGDCEAMGFYPTKDQAEWPADARPLGAPEEDGTPDDGWRFVKCQKCNGSGRVSWAVSILRIPRWIWHGLQFGRQAMRRDMYAPGSTLGYRFRTWMHCSFGSEISRISHELRSR